jgi:hypothetical protein
MQAKVGDHLKVKGHRVGEAPKEAEIVEVRGPKGSPPFLVRWEADGHEGLIFPGADAEIVPAKYLKR